MDFSEHDLEREKKEGGKDDTLDLKKFKKRLTTVRRKISIYSLFQHSNLSEKTIQHLSFQILQGDKVLNPLEDKFKNLNGVGLI